jgi:hypothetical protein
VAGTSAIASALAPISSEKSPRRRSASVNQSSLEIFHGRPRRSSAFSPARRTDHSCGARLAVFR